MRGESRCHPVGAAVSSSPKLRAPLELGATRPLGDSPLPVEGSLKGGLAQQHERWGGEGSASW